MTTEQKMSALAKSFPTLEDAPGVEPWDPAGLNRWASGPAPSSGARHAARFVLSVWNWNNRFDVHSAIRVWDDRHVAAFAAWALKPWYA
jgi:hypothetical protein